MPEDIRIEKSLRPQFLKDYVGQERLVKNLNVYLEAARIRGEALDHVLFTALPVWVKRPWPASLPMRWGRTSK